MARRATEELLSGENPPTAVFAAQNLITIGAVAALRAPPACSTRSRSSASTTSRSPTRSIPGLTVVAQDAGGLGRAAAEPLFARLDGDAEPTRRVVLPTTLIARGSGEIARGTA